MALVGFHFKKITAEKKKPATGKISVNNNVVISKLQEAKLNMGVSKQAGIEFSFEFTVKYTPDIGSITLEGAVVYMGPEDKVKEILDKWQKEKKLTPDVVEQVYNHILHKCNVQSLILGRDMQLPAHIQLPRVSGK
ncbi:hypothetical protein HN789_07540 [archaeon]|jgi:hypothetical protein|nr:hypothetical protein [archaeon]MBT4272225.1 hypothetical protein [archaeon]MBT4460622.1 hypothetical protein [archaeon]MBT4857989.1 hypothetical protein [archaeon]MBT5424164.1 hypothetical protein [archaeon]